MTAEWGVPTPSGHVYHVPTTYADTCDRINDFIQGEIESWDDVERCPEPTWEIVSHLLDEIERQRIVVATVRSEWTEAGVRYIDIDKGMDRWYAGGIDALADVAKRFEEPDCG